jgi:hypothetical protein
MRACQSHSLRWRPPERSADEARAALPPRSTARPRLTSCTVGIRQHATAGSDLRHVPALLPAGQPRGCAARRGKRRGPVPAPACRTDRREMSEVLSIPGMTMLTVMRAAKGPRVVTEESGREAWLRHARSYLRNADLVLARLIDDRPDFDLAEARLDNPFGLVLPMDLFGALLFQITGQQLSVPGDPPDPGPHRGAVRRPSALARRTAGRRSRPAARGGAVLAEDRHAARPRRAPVGRAAGPDGAERLPVLGHLHAGQDTTGRPA